MKFIHTADIHLASPLSSKLPAEKAIIRGREIEETFLGVIKNAAKIGAEAIIIAGDLFDSKRVTRNDYELRGLKL